MEPTAPIETPVSNIALCLSGGGYRAAAYHLGVLKTLEEIGLLSKAKYFSTASGGTITAMKYIVTRMEGKSFEVFYDETSSFLQHTNVVMDAFNILENNRSPSGSNDLSLIRCGAEVYRQKLTGMKRSENAEVPDSIAEEWTIKHLRDAISSGGIFQDLIFNSTEFQTGNSFRFRAVAGRELLFGNQHTHLREELSDQISLADIIASSSCFPGVFEPIRFPEDFRLTDRSQAQTPFAGDSGQIKSIALMDGGILDNQGLHGMTLSYLDEPLPFELMIVSDTTARTDQLLEYNIKPREAGISLKDILRLGMAFLCLLLFCSLSLLGKLLLNLRSLPVWDMFLFGFAGMVLLLLSISALGLILWGKNKIKALPVMGADFPVWNYIKNLDLGDLRTLLSGRLYSAKVMAFSVFMNRIRSLQISYTMSAIAANTRNNLFNGKTVFADIYEMSPANDYKQERKLNRLLEPTDRMKQLSKEAEAIETKLWLNEKELKILIDCGRITVCYSLLKYLWNSKNYETFPKPNKENSPFYKIYEKWMGLRKEFP